MQIECPSAGENVLVVVTGSGGSGTICVHGSFSAIEDTAATIRVRVLNGNVPPSSLPPAVPKQPGDVDVAALSQWCARNVPVPASSASGAPLTAVAWVLTPSGSGGVMSSAPQSVQFKGGGPNPTDCCSGCGSGAGGILQAGELATASALHVTVPDGPRAGTHRASAVAFLIWEATIAGATYRLHALDGGGGLVLYDSSRSTEAAAVAWEPFSAIFAGEVFGAAGEVVVTIA